jgi:VanZ family protein
MSKYGTFRMHRETIFKSEKYAWMAVGLYTIVLYSTLTVAFDAYVSVYDQIGRASMSRWINSGFAVVGIILLGWILLRIRPQISGYMALLLITLVLAFCSYHLKIPAKRFHFLQYAPLTLFIFDAIKFRCRDRGRYVWTLALVAVIGLGDESIQLMLPDRHFGVLDLVINSAASLLTLAFIGFVWGEENYPRSRRVASGR